MSWLIGYAQVSTDDQNTDAQLDALKAAGCTVIFEKHASGGDRERPELARALATVRAGDTLVVPRLDRLARAVVHPLQVIEHLRAAIVLIAGRSGRYVDPARGAHPPDPGCRRGARAGLLRVDGGIRT